MDAVVLAGGQGRRVRTLTQGPKCLMPVRGQPVVDHVVDWLLAWPAVDRVWVAAGYEGAQVRQHIRRRYQTTSVEVAVESEPLGTLGALVQLRTVLSEQIVVANGDTLLEGDLAAMIEHHQRLGAWVTVAAVARGRKDAGMLEPVSLPGPVRRVARRPERHARAFSAGLYVIKRDVLVGARCPGSLEHDLIPSLVAACQARVWAYPWFSAYDIGTVSRYRAVQVHG